MADGYLKIDDCIAQMKRSSRSAFESEMLCLRPSLENVVFAEFDTDIHISPVKYNSALPIYRAIDFGFVNPFVCLWIQVDDEGKVFVIDEYVKSRMTIDMHAEEIKKRTPCGEENAVATFCDPAGAGVNDVSGTSAVSRLRALGVNVRYKRSTILEGVELIRRALRRGDGKSSFVISPKCGRLIEAMTSYHYPRIHSTGSGRAAETELPMKDGIYDHPIDALRYFFVNYKISRQTKKKGY
jgi:phage terminase large subunit